MAMRVILGIGINGSDPHHFWPTKFVDASSVHAPSLALGAVENLAQANLKNIGLVTGLCSKEHAKD